MHQGIIGTLRILQISLSFACFIFLLKEKKDGKKLKSSKIKKKAILMCNMEIFEAFVSELVCSKVNSKVCIQCHSFYTTQIKNNISKFPLFEKVNKIHVCECKTLLQNS